MLDQGGWCRVVVRYLFWTLYLPNWPHDDLLKALGHWSFLELWNLGCLFLRSSGIIWERVVSGVSKVSQNLELMPSHGWLASCPVN